MLLQSSNRGEYNSVRRSHTCKFLRDATRRAARAASGKPISGPSDRTPAAADDGGLSKAATPTFAPTGRDPPPS
jgi:hypothetical protein